MEGGNSIQDSAAAAKILEENGADMISVSGGMCRYIREGHEEPGYFSDMSSEIKKAVSIPVMLTGGVKEAADAERLLREDAADLIGIGRELLKDPRWAVRALETIRHNL
jgi:2,4-dienoyl-CoA reductase-like NADH-dependent reductase (Old Yellow Enzyme family)